jgi:hypothetical protein
MSILDYHIFSLDLCSCISFRTPHLIQLISNVVATSIPCLVAESAQAQTRLAILRHQLALFSYRRTLQRRLALPGIFAACLFATPDTSRILGLWR